MLQKLWISGLNWDDPISNGLQNQWEDFRNKLSTISTIKIPRWISLQPDTYAVELHAFCDASTLAYAGSVYCRCLHNNGTISVHLLAAKTKVAPIRQISIPRLELCGAVLVTNLVAHIQNSMKLKFSRIVGWTDSLNVLAWLKGHPRLWQTFVANRVSQIQEHGVQWRYVKSGNNPADCASRGVSPNELENHTLWWKGPSWLQTSEDQWPTNIGDTFQTNLEAKKVALNSRTTPNTSIDIIQRFSNLNRLVNVLAYCKRYIYNLKVSKSQRRKYHLSSIEIDEARRTIEKIVQSVYFTQEIEALHNRHPLPKTSRILNLNPILDTDGLLRVGGRLKYAELPYNQKYPILLPEKSHFTTLVINNCHAVALHGGAQLTLNLIRKRYWILNARKAVRQRIHQCITCFRYNTTTREQLMGNLPDARVQQNRPFQHTGVDFSGYVIIRESKCRGRPKTSKGYICVFVCLSTKAVHLELVSDLTTDAFLAAFRRFTGRRGLCSDVYSDCGTNFIGASAQLTKNKFESKFGISQEVLAALSIKGTQWHFIPPASPHFGGLWEAGVKSMKHHLKRVIGNTLLTFEELTTVLV